MRSKGMFILLVLLLGLVVGSLVTGTIIAVVASHRLQEESDRAEEARREAETTRQALQKEKDKQPDDKPPVTVFFLVDRSHSIAEEMEAVADAPGKQVDRRLKRIEQFINESVARRGAEHKHDKAGVILFGRRPSLEVPPTDAAHFRFKFKVASRAIDCNHTDIGAAIRLAVASFPEGSDKRIVLISDGNENLGNAEEQANLAKLNRVQIDVVPLAAGRSSENEVLVESVDVSENEPGSQLPIRVSVRSFNPNAVVGTLTVKQVGIKGQSSEVPDSPRREVALRPGLNVFTFTLPKTDLKRPCIVEAEFQPERVQDDKGKILFKGLPGDRLQNNRAAVHVVDRGQRRILVVEAAKGEQDFLAQTLKKAGDNKFQVYPRAVASLPADRLGDFLSAFDCVILANVPAESFSEKQQEELRSNTHDQNRGLIMVGGPDSFGAGGWQNTPVEKALPVDCDIPHFKGQGKGGLVLIMDASAMVDGAFRQKQLAKLAVGKLSSVDEIGVLYYSNDSAAFKWQLGLKPIGDQRRALLGQIDKLAPGSMPEYDTALKMASDVLSDPKRGLAIKHVILISRGHGPQIDRNLLAHLKKNGVTVTTVGVWTGGGSPERPLADLAQATGGRYYSVKDPKSLPAIYTREARLVNQAFLYEKSFQPEMRPGAAPTEKLPGLPRLHGFLRTTPKGSPLVEVSIVTPPLEGHEFPILTRWHYGLGRAAAFTSDACAPPGKKAWSRDWAESEVYGKFWEQLVDWSVGPVESSRLNMITEYRDGKVKVIVEARENKDGKRLPITDFRIQGGVTALGVKAEDAHNLELKFEQKDAGVYQAEFQVEDAGSYYIDARAARKIKKDGREVEDNDSVRGAVTIPYSAEFGELRSNTALLEKLREMTGGQSYADDGAALTKAARSGEVFRPSPWPEVRPSLREKRE